MQGMVQAFRQPVAQHVYLCRIPLFEYVEDPELVVDLAAHLVHVVARKVHVPLAEVLARPTHIGQAEDGADQTALVVPRQFRERRLQHGH